MRTVLKKQSLTPNLDKYQETFGHLPTLDQFKFKRLEELDEIARVALRRNKPVKAWTQGEYLRELPSQTTGHR